MVSSVDTGQVDTYTTRGAESSMKQLHTLKEALLCGENVARSDRGSVAAAALKFAHYTGACMRFH